MVHVKTLKEAKGRKRTQKRAVFAFLLARIGFRFRFRFALLGGLVGSRRLIR